MMYTHIHTYINIQEYLCIYVHACIHSNIALQYQIQHCHEVYTCIHVYQYTRILMSIFTCMHTLKHDICNVEFNITIMRTHIYMSIHCINIVPTIFVICAQYVRTLVYTVVFDNI